MVCDTCHDRSCNDNFNYLFKIRKYSYSHRDLWSLCFAHNRSIVTTRYRIDKIKTHNMFEKINQDRLLNFLKKNSFIGSAFIPTRCASRIAFLQVLFFSLLIFNYYSASVVSSRLKNKEEKMNDSLINLAKSNLKLAVEPTPYIHSFLQVTFFS